MMPRLAIPPNVRRILPIAAALAILGGAAWIVYTIVSWLVRQLVQLPHPVSVALVTGAFTVLAATATVVAGKLYERRKDREALYRDKKVEIYDAFLQQLFTVFQAQDSGAPLVKDFVAFMTEWHRKMILWGGPQVVKAYAEWVVRLRRGDATIGSVVETENLFRALRRDLGHNDRSLPPGSITHLWLRDSELILYAAKVNPHIPLSRIAEIVAKTSKAPENAKPS